MLDMAPDSYIAQNMTLLERLQIGSLGERKITWIGLINYRLSSESKSVAEDQIRTWFIESGRQVTTANYYTRMIRNICYSRHLQNVLSGHMSIYEATAMGG